jgi:hypothetical protein
LKGLYQSSTAAREPARHSGSKGCKCVQSNYYLTDCHHQAK